MSDSERYDLPRDFAGYGGSPPVGAWPSSGARVAISLVINIEDGAERHRSRGDAVDDVHAHWVTDVPHDSGNPSLESGYDYGSRAGIWRLLRILDAHEVPSTAFVCGRALDQHPDLGRALATRGIEIVDHGLRWEPHHDLTSAELHDRIEQSARILRRTTDSNPTSWYSKDGHSRASLPMMAAQGYLHDSNCFSDDYPFLPAGIDGPVTIPYSADTNDSLLLTTIATGNQYLAQLVDGLDMLLTEERTGPKVLSVGLHPRWIGRPAYAGSLQKFIAHALATPGVVFAERRQIASWWRSMVSEQPAPAGDIGLDTS